MRGQWSLTDVEGHMELSWIPEIPLSDGSYIWRARAMDDAAPGPWSEPWTFVVGVPAVLDAGELVDAQIADAQVILRDTQVADAQAPAADIQLSDAQLDINVAPQDINPQADVSISSGSVSGDGCACESSGQDGSNWMLLFLLLGWRRRRRG